jgi:hypothetical protein
MMKRRSNRTILFGATGRLYNNGCESTSRIWIGMDFYDATPGCDTRYMQRDTRGGSKVSNVWIGQET